MDYIKPAQKINNSYESEPSSGSGSSLGDNNDYNTFEEEPQLNLPYLLRPATLSDCNTPKTNNANTSPSIISKSNIEEMTNEYQRKFKSSPDDLSPFKGFNDSPFCQINTENYSKPTNINNYVNDALESNTVKLNLVKYNQSIDKKKHRESKDDYDIANVAFKGFVAKSSFIEQPLSTDMNRENIVQPPSDKKLYHKFYDTIVEENSCNAVDIKLSNELPVEQMELSDNINNQEPAELSFNGMIKNLTNDTVEASTSTIHISKQIKEINGTHMNYSEAINTNNNILTELFILKKYNNEKSPDIFADDDNDDDDDGNDDADDDEDNANAINHINKNNNDYKKDCTHTVTEPNTSTGDINDISSNRSRQCPTELSFADELTFDNTMLSNESASSLLENNIRRERELLRRIRKCLSGVPPPPSLTIPQINLIDTIVNRKNDILNFLSEKSTTVEVAACTSSNASLFKPTHTLEEVKEMNWKDILAVRHHGLCYNLTKSSENAEYLSLSVIERFIGAETASSYRHSPSSAKKRNMRMKLLTQSPGNRLSHLAKRRAIFSSANLAINSQKCTSALGPQILIDTRKNKNKRKGTTPKRKTPGSKRKNRKTPTSSARKRLLRCDLSIKSGPSRETSKRALFQSPAKKIEPKQIQLPKPIIKPEIANRVEKSKRALFSPENDKTNQNNIPSYTQPSTNTNDIRNNLLNLKSKISTSNSKFEAILKRKRDDALDNEMNNDVDYMELARHQSKLMRLSSNENLTPRSLKIKSQSFCIGAGSSTLNTTIETIAKTSTTQISNSQIMGSDSTSNLTLGIPTKIQRANSDITSHGNTLTENQRKKLLWAVSQALQEKKITSKHENFKQFAAVLARVVRRIFQEYYQKTSTSNSETMLRLSKKYVYNVIMGHNVDDIYFKAKSHIDEQKRKSSTRLSGYIGPEEYQQRKLSQQNSQTTNKSLMNFNSTFGIDNSFDPFNMSISQQSLACLSTTSSISQMTFTEQNISQDILLSQQTNSSNNNSAIKSKQQTSTQKRLPIQLNNNLQNSSSKSNLGDSALRENIDGEQRRSAQKMVFTGKNQRNISPYAIDKVNSNSTTTTRFGSAIKLQSSCKLNDTVGAKAKRQILFDS